MHFHQVGQMGRLMPLAQPHTALAGKWNSGTNALILALAELLLLVLLLLRWLVRRQGGWRRSWRRLRRQVRLTWGAFSDPVREFLRFRAEVRQLTHLLATADAVSVAGEALDDVDAAVAGTAADEAFAFAARVARSSRRTSGEVVVHLAGRRVPPAATPWTADGDERRWSAPADAVAPPDPAETGAVPRLLVPVGLYEEALVVLDLMRGPGILSTYGDRTAGRAFVQAVAAYLDLPGGTARVIVARGVHPRHDGPELDALLDSLEGTGPTAGEPVVVVCAAPDAQQSARLSELAAAGLLRAVVAGPVTGHRWEVRVDSRGRTQTPGLGLGTDAAPLGPAVARTARRGGISRGKRATPAPRRTAPVPPRTPRTAGQPATPSAVPRPASPRVTAPSGPPPHRQPAPEPPAPAIRELFAEPEITGVSAADSREAASYTTPQEESRNGS
ncbi:hypothetical protein OG552_15170 [Streptomyces sp. NBC_01476]|uniref:hypothetical protein n=1 Tax=Streptomyces sp. NBC_01476 TaxID=2903881 RepID=UPI002E305A44|nr:hypothetical protein [Streptomyces sp. NBC_01476]